MNEKKPYLLTIAIPTYNRAKILKVAINRLLKEIEYVKYPVEFIISDNCSTDTTEDIVNAYILKGASIKYIRNVENLGMDGNFVQCFTMAKGKYVWVLGDDDYIKKDSLNKVLDILNKKEIGLLHLQIKGTKKDFTYYTNSELFLSNISIWITFISSNIVNTKYVPLINFSIYMGSYFTLIPLYLTASLKASENCMIHYRVLENGVDSENNGGYNFFQVFFDNYLNIWAEFKKNKQINDRLFKKIKKDDLFYWKGMIYKLLVLKEKGNYSIDNGKEILDKWYKRNIYYYIFKMYVFIKRVIKKDKRIND